MPSVFFASDCPDLHYNGVGLDDHSSSDAMPSNRPNLKLNEQSFQGLLSAAFTIQEYNDRRKLARQTQADPEAHPEQEADRLCQHCGALMPADALRCDFLPLPVAKEAAKETITQGKTETIHDLTVHPFPLSASDDSTPIEARTDAPIDASIDASGDSTSSLIQPKPTGNAMAHSATPRAGSFQRAPLSGMQLTAERAELLNCVPNHLLREIVQQALKAAHANGAVIALEHQGELICRAVAGDSASEIGTRINTRSGPTGICASSRTVQSWSNTELESGVDADAYRELGVSAVMVVPLLHQDQLLGVMEVLSRRPFAFGMRDRQALQGLAEQFTANLQLSAESVNANTGYESPGVRAASDPLAGERNQGHFAGMRKFGLYTLAVIACVLIGFYWIWKLLDPMTNPAKGQVTLISIVPAVPARLSHSHVVEGTLLHSVDPTYPRDALRQRIQGQVGLEVRIGKDGLVYVATAIRGDPILSQAAVEAVRQWRFSPYRMNNKAFEVAAQITFEFSLAK